MKEWSNKNWYNSFNSAKGLLYRRWYESIIEWRDKEIVCPYVKKNNPLPPIEASIDPSPNGACCLNCRHCNAHRYLGKAPAIPDKALIDLHKFLIDWGVLAFCEGGGGDPTLRKNLSEIFWLIKTHNRQSSIATNGVLLDDKLIDALAICCRWVAISVDCSNKKTYNELKGADYFDRVINNISKLVKKVNQFKTNCDVAFKFLISPYNENEIVDACKIAKELGVRDFHARPMDLQHQGMGDQKIKNWNYNVKLVQEQFDKCHQMETDNFRVFTVVHKFDERFRPIKNFTQCYAMPLIIQCCPDGNVYACVDQRLQEDFKLGSYYPNPENILNFWGGKKHYDLAFGNTPKRCKTRCTFTKYCEQCEILFANDNDPMCMNFT